MPYRYLTQGRQFTGGNVLYLGDDHLLVAERQLFVNRYRRFFFDDLLSIALVPNHRVWVRAGVVLAVAALASLPLLAYGHPLGGAVTGLMGIVLAGLDVLFGRNLTVQVWTVHSRFAAPVRLRERHALDFLEKLAPHLPVPPS